MYYFGNLLTIGLSHEAVPSPLVLSKNLYNLLKDKLDITEETTLRELALLLNTGDNLEIYKDLLVFNIGLSYKLKENLSLKETEDEIGKLIEETLIENIDYLDYGYYLTDIPYSGDDISNLKQLLKYGILKEIDYITCDYVIFETDLSLRRELDKEDQEELKELFNTKANITPTMDGKEWYLITIGDSPNISSLYGKKLNLLETTRFILETFTREQADFLLRISKIYNNTRSRQFIFKSINGKLAIPLKGE